MMCCGGQRGKKVVLSGPGSFFVPEPPFVEEFLLEYPPDKKYTLLSCNARDVRSSFTKFSGDRRAGQDPGMVRRMARSIDVLNTGEAKIKGASSLPPEHRKERSRCGWHRHPMKIPMMNDPEILIRIEQHAGNQK